MNNSNLPQMLPANLTPSSTTSELLDVITELKFQGEDEALAATRVVLDAWADEFSVAPGLVKEVRLLDPDQKIAISSMLVLLSRAQAKRLFDEVYSEIVPHMASQRQMLLDLESGRASSSPMMQAAASLMKDLPEGLGGIFASLQTQVQALTWRDDGNPEISSHVTLDMNVSENGVIPSIKGRGVKF